MIDLCTIIEAKAMTILLVRRAASLFCFAPMELMLYHLLCYKGVIPTGFYISVKETV